MCVWVECLNSRYETCDCRGSELEVFLCSLEPTLSGGMVFGPLNGRENCCESQRMRGIWSGAKTGCCVPNISVLNAGKISLASQVVETSAIARFGQGEKNG